MAIRVLVGAPKRETNLRNAVSPKSNGRVELSRFTERWKVTGTSRNPHNRPFLESPKRYLKIPVNVYPVGETVRPSQSTVIEHGTQQRMAQTTLLASCQQRR